MAVKRRSVGRVERKRNPPLNHRRTYVLSNANLVRILLITLCNTFDKLWFWQPKARNWPFKDVKQRYFALEQTAKGVNVSQSNSVEDVEPLVLLDEELQQSDRFISGA